MNQATSNGTHNGTLPCNGKAEGGKENGKVGKENGTSFLNNYNRPGITQDDRIRMYTEWAGQYDLDLCPSNYKGPQIAAQFLADHYASAVREKMQIIDVAAGTGRVGAELVKLGFRHIDALEPSAGMMILLQQRGIYGKTYECPIGNEQIAGILSDFYDALVISGGMGEGLIPVTAMDEMIRIVKPGGMIVIAMREKYLSNVADYVDKLEPYMDSLVDKGAWCQVERTVVPEYSFNNNGVVFSYKVL